MNLLPLLALLFFARGRGGAAPKPPAPSPSVVPLGTPAIVRTPGGNVPVTFEMVTRKGKSQAAWSVQDLASSNLGKVQTALAKDVGKSFVVDVRRGQVFRATWDGFVFVPT